MLPPIIKKSEALSKEELIQLNEISRLVYSKNPENHIEDNHIKKTNPLFYLFKKENKILAFQAFTFFSKRTPFSKKPIPIIYINTSYKKPDSDQFIKNYAKQSYLDYIKKQLGPFWYMKKFLLVFITNNPKLFNRSSKSFFVSYPNHQTPTPKKVFSFAKNFISDDLKIGKDNISKNLIISEACYEEGHITKSWSSLYKAKDNSINELFFNEGIVNFKNNEYYIGNKAALFLGLHSLGGVIKKILYKR